MYAVSINGLDKNGNEHHVVRPYEVSYLFNKSKSIDNA